MFQMETELSIQSEMCTYDIFLQAKDQKRKYCYSEEDNENIQL